MTNQPNIKSGPMIDGIGHMRGLSHNYLRKTILIPIIDEIKLESWQYKLKLKPSMKSDQPTADLKLASGHCQPMTITAATSKKTI